MKILHISPHYGGGVGTVVSALIKNDPGNTHMLVALEKMEDTRILKENTACVVFDDIQSRKYRGWPDADVILVHTWDNHPLLQNLFGPELRHKTAYWSHNNVAIPPETLAFPAKFIGTSPIQGHKEWIWSTGDISRFRESRENQPKDTFHVGYVGGTKKISPFWWALCQRILHFIPQAQFTFVGLGARNRIASDWASASVNFHYVAKTDDVLPYLRTFDVFGYPMDQFHTGTCEQVLGEAMACGVVPVVMDRPAERTIVLHGKNGLIATPSWDKDYIRWRSELDVYVELIVYLYDQPALRRAMGEIASEDAGKLYDVHKMVAEWNRVWRELQWR